MKRILGATLLVISLLMLASIKHPGYARTCTDNDGDGETTCGRKIYGVRIYDCDDNDPNVNACEQSTIHYPEIYEPPSCSSSGMRVTSYNCTMPSSGPRPTSCPEPGTPAELCPEIPSGCTVVDVNDYLVYYSCS